MNRTFSSIASRAWRGARRATGRLGRDQRGIAAIEMALIFPVMIVLYFGLVDATDVLSAKRRVTLAASNVGDLVTQAPGNITDAELDAFYGAVQPIMDPFPANDVGVEIFTFKIVGAAISLAWADNNGKTCGGTPDSSGFANLMTDGNDVIVARVCITRKLVVAELAGQPEFTLLDEIALRPRQSAVLLKNGVARP